LAAPSATQAGERVNAQETGGGGAAEAFTSFATGGDALPAVAEIGFWHPSVIGFWIRIPREFCDSSFQVAEGQGSFEPGSGMRVASLKRTPKRIPDWENEAPLPHK
jgi:hypothetical protein